MKHFVGVSFITALCIMQHAVWLRQVVCSFVRPSVYLSVCDIDVMVSWSHTLDFLKNNFIAD